MYDNNNIFAKIIRKEIPCKVVYEDKKVLFFYDINPQAKIHILESKRVHSNLFDILELLLLRPNRD